MLGAPDQTLFLESVVFILTMGFIPGNKVIQLKTYEQTIPEKGSIIVVGGMPDETLTETQTSLWRNCQCFGAIPEKALPWVASSIASDYRGNQSRASDRAGDSLILCPRRG